MSEGNKSTDRHTPGPWSNERIWDTPESRIHARVEGVPMALAEVFTMRNAGEKEANARLIAAAPELLEVLRKVRDQIDDPHIGVIDHRSDVALVSAIRIAVAKAEGRS